MPRLVRRAPLLERLKAYLDPLDWLMWISEELNTHDWEEFTKDYALALGFGMNLMFIIARANASSGSEGNDVLIGTGSGGPGWFAWFCKIIVLGLVVLAFLNGFLTFYQKRHYRLFEQPIETTPATPSAQRVRVDSSPTMASPMGMLKRMIGAGSAESRAHPDAGRDVWEIALWDPNPLCLSIFCLFSPLHIMLYCSTLPVAPLDPQPSVKVVTTVAIGAMLSLQLWYLQSSFARQVKDNSVIQRSVMHEYDNKFVHPRFQRICRDVGIQTISRKKGRDSSVGVRGSSDDLASDVTTYTPTTILNRTFRTNPNTNYASQYDPDHLSAAHSTQQTPSLRPAYSNSNYTSTTTATGTDFSSPIRPSNTPNPFRQQPSQVNFRATGTGDGGSLGVYSHANSPLRKAASTNFIREDRGRDSLGGQGERRHGATPARREGSPLKRVSMPGNINGAGGEKSAAAERLSRYGGMGVGRRESGRF